MRYEELFKTTYDLNPLVDSALNEGKNSQRAREALIQIKEMFIEYKEKIDQILSVPLPEVPEREFVPPPRARTSVRSKWMGKYIDGHQAIKSDVANATKDKFFTI